MVNTVSVCARSITSGRTNKAQMALTIINFIKLRCVKCQYSNKNLCTEYSVKFTSVGFCSFHLIDGQQ